ncbi:peptidoglycan DD-metalloendopeptidase family protein [Candidatus Nomurabacteria bacterium]|nr:peptidoglycan DD-metalloendopeptidase family protein [Candidatus Nomurabacteria bacterium]
MFGLKKFSILVLIAVVLLFEPYDPLLAYDASKPWYQNYSHSVSQKTANLGSMPIEEFYLPILFGVDLGDFAPNFGVARGGGSRTHEGQDIIAANGTPIVSPTSAVVTHIHYGESAGNSVYTANPGNETFAYLHLQRVNPNLSVGDTLQVGDLLGYVGDTGNAKGGAAHLHFEVLRNEPTDPYPRITKEFSPQEKMSLVWRMFESMTEADKKHVAGFLGTEYREDFSLARSRGYPLPPEIVHVLDNPDTYLQPQLDLTVGSSGQEVARLQQLLIDANAGIYAQGLASVRATGYFGSLTSSALLEYQLAKGISPANGYYGKETRDYLEARSVKSQDPLPIVEDSSTEVVPNQPLPEILISPKTTYDLSHMPNSDLSSGDKGIGVTWLQTFLIAQDTGPHAKSLSDVGATGYFGQLTTKALAEYQATQNISPAIGYYGPLTRARIKK